MFLEPITPKRESRDDEEVARRPRNQDHVKKSDSPLPSCSHGKDLWARKGPISPVYDPPNQPVGHSEPGCPVKKQKRWYAEPLRTLTCGNSGVICAAG